MSLKIPFTPNPGGCPRGGGASPQERQTPSKILQKKSLREKSPGRKRIPSYSTHCAQSCAPHGIFSIFHFSAHILIPRITSTSSSPLFVKVYSLRTGNEVASTFRVDNPLRLKFPETLRQNLLRDLPQRILELREPARVPRALVQFKNDQERPLLCQIFHGHVDRARIVHGMVSETLSYLILVYKRYLVVKQYEGVPKMFCYQCEETAKGTGLHHERCLRERSRDRRTHGCPDLSERGNCRAQHRSSKNREGEQRGRHVHDRIPLCHADQHELRRCPAPSLIAQAIAIRDALPKSGATEAEACTWTPKNDADIAAKAAQIAEAANKNDDVSSLRALLLFGLKGVAAYYHHALVLGYSDEKIHIFYVSK